ncbi:nucleotidyltransferase family protein [Methylophaga pinxianii]|uniref:nucleotidyltransferase family protein n=1 Tax=Methylophaga pinxianii TaxID=2881052 RepID=UPI001CF433A1|nr:nucleotidyltransferase family protein [Methylophaga pinxianii]MCB2425580.1 nucleotidyltransferase family protein [Methylophaga pinxianii]UPH45026.1 nucleotidyltransferase family protein [Methylophaga pinxianii]
MTKHDLDRKMHKRRTQIEALLLAAGRSSRFGEDKLLVEMTIKDKKCPLIDHVLHNWLQVFERVTLLVRADHVELHHYLKSSSNALRIRLAESQNAQLGMGHSIALGVKSTIYSDGWVIGLADMPFIPVNVIEAVYLALMNGSEIALPVRDKQRGHPVGFSKQYQQQLLSLTGDSGARSIVTKNLASVTRVPTQRCKDDPLATVQN